ncbi:hypothetical protein DWB84_13505 [Saccharophagus sp. K07]|uniref:NPCBM/NEW2 domain-containing protein n=1 Tax=Saccharophagus sp. K07 TaxID=2283636 RepID=UPI001651F351|nr:NPCBM/NEW2 domain-containing protein [Saccharophagus sp. K07]MBC6906473.1 hypothetical protein [Saccharophagus sp. K07]
MKLGHGNLSATDLAGRKGQFSELNTYLIASVFANLFCLLSYGYDGDIGYWREWIRQLQTQGYGGFEGNYPPVYVHWLWVCAKLASVLGLSLETHIEVKALSVIPVMFVHLLIIRLVYDLTQKWTVSPEKRKFINWLTALNPVFLSDGPMWGQVDLFPTAVVAVGLLAAHSASSRYFILIVPLYCLALLTKFQMIAFAPVFGFIFFRQLKISLISIIPAIFLLVLVLLPFAVGKNLLGVLDNAYVKTLGQYPLATMYAANTWMAFYGNMQPDNLRVLPLLLGEAATIKNVGILLFALLSIAVFSKGCYLVYQERKGADVSTLDSYIWRAALTCSFGFFIVLPGMHERYLFSASVIAIFYIVRANGSLPIALLVTLCALLNILIVLPLRGDELWKPLAFFSCLVFAAFMLDSWWPRAFHKAKVIGRRLMEIKGLPEAILLCVLVVPLAAEKYFFWANESIRDNEIRLTELQPTSVRQDWGRLNINKTVAGDDFSVGFIRYRHGLGTHANSRIEYSLDGNYEAFRFRVGVNEDSRNGSMRFEVYGDGKLLWKSGRMSGGEIEGEVILNIKGITKLTLVVNSLGPINSDHANWLNPVLRRYR